MEAKQKNAIIIGASSGIGEALTREFHAAGWTLGILARRIELLEDLAWNLGSEHITIGHIDVTRADSVDRLRDMIDYLKGVDLIVLSSGVGFLNPAHDPIPDQETIEVNVVGFQRVALAAFQYFRRRGSGHLAAITSVASLRSNSAGAVYAASKAFQSVYLDGLRDSAAQSGLPITITELQPGFVDTAMMKTSAPLHPFVHRLLVSDPSTAARQMHRAISRRRQHSYITRRYGLIAFLMRLLPRPGN